VEDFVEGTAVLAIAVADQEADVLVGEVEAEVARLLGSPSRQWDSSCSRPAKRVGLNAR
jgi:hypothetical protein